jgi:hypothetical protein
MVQLETQPPQGGPEMGVGEGFPTDDHPPAGIDGEESARMSREDPGEAGGSV